MTSYRAEKAIKAYEAGRRRRNATGAIERTADAALAAGGTILANAVLSLNLGLPGGRAGMSLGASLVCAGLAWMTRHRGQPKPRRATPITLRAPKPIAHAAFLDRAA